VVIRLRDIQCYAYHGVLEEEKQQGNTFRVNVAITIDSPKGVESDCIQDTLDYRGVCDIVRTEMSVPSELLENVAGRIVKAIEQKFPELVSFSVRVSKKRPPVDGVAQWSRVTLYH
jgi:dihydroneopterin aldolase